MSAAGRRASGAHGGIGSWLAPAVFLPFFILGALGGPLAVAVLGWRRGVMTGFDVASTGFLLSTLPLAGRPVAEMRRAAARNTANRGLLLAMTMAVLVAILLAVASELAPSGRPDAATLSLVVITLALTWSFAHVVYALHYAHLYYVQTSAGGDSGGLAFPTEPEPNYADFLYFAFTIGMTFQTSDVAIQSRPFRLIVLGHGLAAFVFGLGVIAFTVNVLGGG